MRRLGEVLRLRSSAWDWLRTASRTSAEVGLAWLVGFIYIFSYCNNFSRTLMIRRPKIALTATVLSNCSNSCEQLWCQLVFRMALTQTFGQQRESSDISVTPANAILEQQHIATVQVGLDAFLELRASEHSYDAFLSLPPPMTLWRGCSSMTL